MRQAATRESSFFAGPYPIKPSGAVAKRRPGPDTFFQKAWLKRALSKGRVNHSAFLELVQETHSRLIGSTGKGEDYTLAQIACTDRAIAQCDSRESAVEVSVLAACSLAMKGTPVHLVFADPPETLPLLQQLADSLALSVGWVREGMQLEDRKQGYQASICVASARQLMYDFLLDQKILGQSSGPLLSRLKVSLRETPQLMLPGLRCAVVAEAYEVFIEQGERPVGISEAVRSRSSHAQNFYREAIFLAKALEPGVHFDLKESDSLSLNEAGRKRLTVASQNMGPLWRGSRRRENIVVAALLLMSVLESDAQPAPELSSISGRLPSLGGLELSDYSKLYSAITSQDAADSAPPVSMRLCAQNFFTRYLHLSASGCLLQPRLKELQRVYDLVPGPANGAEPVPLRNPGLFRDVESWQSSLEAELSRLSNDHSCVLVISPGRAEQERLEARMPNRLQALDVSGDGVGRTDRATSVAIEDFIALPADHALERFDHVLFAGTPPTILQEIRVIDRLGANSATSFAMWASPGDSAFESQRFYWAPINGLNHWMFRRGRLQIERLESRGRQQVAAQDTYINDVLTFSARRE